MRHGPLAAPAITGVVQHGDKRGRELGFPTANIAVEGEDTPPFGVYAGTLDGRPAAISVGVRPTFGDGLRPLLEAYVLDFSGDLYGRSVRVELVQRLRGEVRFEGIEALVAQIERDVEDVRAVFA